MNSHYTETVFRQTFTRLSSTQLQVLYPTVNFALYDSPMEGDLDDIPLMKTSRITFLSLNRYERKKDIGLAISALGTNQFPIILYTFIYKHMHIQYLFNRHRSNNQICPFSSTRHVEWRKRRSSNHCRWL